MDPTTTNKKNTNGNTTETEKHAAAEAPKGAAELHTPGAVELTETQGKILALIGLWQPDSQRRVLNATGLVLGIQLGATARPPGANQQGRPPQQRQGQR